MSLNGSIELGALKKFVAVDLNAGLLGVATKTNVV